MALSSGLAQKLRAGSRGIRLCFKRLDLARWTRASRGGMCLRAMCTSTLAATLSSQPLLFSAVERQAAAPNNEIWNPVQPELDKNLLLLLMHEIGTYRPSMRKWDGVKECQALRRHVVSNLVSQVDVGVVSGATTEAALRSSSLDAVPQLPRMTTTQSSPDLQGLPRRNHILRARSVDFTHGGPQTNDAPPPHDLEESFRRAEAARAMSMEISHVPGIESWQVKGLNTGEA